MKTPSRTTTVCTAVALFVASAPNARLSAAPKVTELQRQVDRSIVAGLRYISRNQQPSGAWGSGRHGESTAVTSLAIMAFMSAGHVPGEGPYGDQIQRAIRWVISQQRANGMIVSENVHGPMYSHGISTLMLCEVIGMVDSNLGKECRRSMESAVRLILAAQETNKKSVRHKGGWRYQTTSGDSDLSVTGWQLLALRAAKNVGCDVPADNIDAAISYVKNCAGPSGFGYQDGFSASTTRTGTGIVALEVCGEHHAPESLNGARRILQRGLHAGETWFYYGAYYCCVGMFKIGGEQWDKAKPQLFDTILRLQGRDGGWQPGRGGEGGAGPVYSTSMSILGLAVEYRYLPIYQR